MMAAKSTSPTPQKTMSRRQLRRRHRHRQEEIIGWIVVPLIVWSLIWAGLEVKERFGTMLLPFLGQQSKQP